LPLDFPEERYGAHPDLASSPGRRHAALHEQPGRCAFFLMDQCAYAPTSPHTKLRIWWIGTSGRPAAGLVRQGGALNVHKPDWLALARIDRNSLRTASLPFVWLSAACYHHPGTSTNTLPDRATARWSGRPLRKISHSIAELRAVWVGDLVMRDLLSSFVRSPAASPPQLTRGATARMRPDINCWSTSVYTEREVPKYRKLLNNRRTSLASPCAGPDRRRDTPIRRGGRRSRDGARSLSETVWKVSVAAWKGIHV